MGVCAGRKEHLEHEMMNFYERNHEKLPLKASSTPKCSHQFKLPLQNHLIPISTALSLSGRMLLCGSDDNNIHIWDTMTAQHNSTLGGHDNRVTSICMAPNGMALVSSSWDQAVRVWV